MPADRDGPPSPTPLPFVVAVGLFVAIAILAFVFLREDSAERIVRPHQINRLDDRTVALVLDSTRLCAEVIRVQVDLVDDAVYLEAIVDDSTCAPDETGTGQVLDVVLPESIDDRRLLPGVGRLQLPCDSGGRCRAEQ